MYVQAVYRMSCGKYVDYYIRSIIDSSHVCSVAPRCPTCQQPISRDKIISDKILQKEIQSLDVYCSNKDKGCDWQGTLKDYLVRKLISCDIKLSIRFTQKHVDLFLWIVQMDVV